MSELLINGKNFANADLCSSYVNTENLPNSREKSAVAPIPFWKERNPQFIIKNVNPNLLILPLSTQKVAFKQSPKMVKKQWNQLNIKEYDSNEAFIKIIP